MYTLYNFSGAGGVAIEAVLADAGIAFKKIDVKLESDGKDADGFRKINPRGQVPALRLPDDSVMTESAAMLIHLADAHPQANLAPPPGSADRAQVLRWLLFFAVNVYEGELRRHYADRYTKDPDGAAAVKDAAAASVVQSYALFEDALRTRSAEGPYFLGSQISILDYYVWMLSYWVGDRSWIPQKCPRVEALTQALRTRPAIAPIHKAQLA